MREIITEKYTLRRLLPGDAESLAVQLDNKKVWDNLRDALPYPYTVKDAQEFIALADQESSVTCYGIVVDGHVVGAIGFSRKSDIERFSAEAGYYLGESYWGRGIMSAALKSAVDDYFSSTDVVRLFATPFAYNGASAKVLRNAGFSFKCTMTKAAYKNGRFVDMLYFEKIK